MCRCLDAAGPVFLLGERDGLMVRPVASVCVGGGRLRDPVVNDFFITCFDNVNVHLPSDHSTSACGVKTVSKV